MVVVRAHDRLYARASVNAHPRHIENYITDNEHMDAPARQEGAAAIVLKTSGEARDGQSCSAWVFGAGSVSQGPRVE